MDGLQGQIMEGVLDRKILMADSFNQFFGHDNLLVSGITGNMIYDSLSIMLLILDENGKAIDCNRSFRKYIKRPKSDIIGNYLWEILFGKENYPKNNIISALEITKKRQSTEIKVKNKWLKISADPILDSKKNIKNIIVVFSDITERKNNITERNNFIKDLEIAFEKTKESDRLKSAFLANISHEIRTPLNGIMGFSKLLEMENISKDEIKSYVKIINSCSNQLLDVVNDILDISKIETGQISIYNESFNIKTFLNIIYQRFKNQFAEKGIRFNLNYDVQNIVEVTTDKRKLGQIISNLLSNALKFTKTGYVELSCNINHNFLKFKVLDTGIGIDKSMHEKIFERFRQVELNKSRNYEGNGLGLSICKGFVELLGGEIRIESEKGKGSIFFFNVPFSQAK